MSPWLLTIVSAIYIYTGVEQGVTKDWNWLGVWCSYAAANYFMIRLTA
jgi:hypothetical protein